MLSTTFTILIPVLFVLLLGFFAWRIKAFDAEQVTGINELALDFTLPASLFVGIVNIPRTQLVQDASLVVGPRLLYQVSRGHFGNRSIRGSNFQAWKRRDLRKINRK